MRVDERRVAHAPASIHQHMSAYVSIRQAEGELVHARVDERRVAHAPSSTHIVVWGHI
jgi:hypothetical protein